MMAAFVALNSGFGNLFEVSEAENVERAVAERPSDSWKIYTMGDPLSAKTKYPWRRDDERLVYPFYEKAIKAGIRTICVHMGPASGAVKNQVFGLNSARLYNLNLHTE